MLHNKVSNGVLGQLRQVWTEVRLVNLLPKVRCDHMKNLFNHVTADLIGKENRNSVVTENKRNGSEPICITG